MGAYTDGIEVPFVTEYGRGNTQVVALPSPGVGNDVSYTLGGAAEWCLESVSVLLTAAGGGSARLPSLRLVDGVGVVFFAAGAPFTVASGSASRYVWATDIQPFGANNAATIGTSIPRLRLYEGLSIETDTVNRGGSDLFTEIRFFVSQYPIRPY